MWLLQVIPLKKILWDKMLWLEGPKHTFWQYFFFFKGSLYDEKKLFVFVFCDYFNGSLEKVPCDETRWKKGREYVLAQISAACGKTSGAETSMLYFARWETMMAVIYQEQGILIHICCHDLVQFFTPFNVSAIFIFLLLF